ncbi:MAG: hypothetical protein QGH60_15450 [Phycisphaerae bacterium]|jgi:hypothetical protein|nr:hypothetical protein [Phycisphaerae bacterium]
MKYKVIAIITLAVCVVAAWRDLTAKPPPVERLLDAPTSFPANSLAGIRNVALPSANLAGLCQRGRVNVFTFYSDSCPGSGQLRGYIGRFTKMRPDVTFQMVDLGPQWRQKDCDQAYGIKLGRVPHVMIYDSGGGLLAGDTDSSKDGLELLLEWMNKEVAARGPRTST